MGWENYFSTALMKKYSDPEVLLDDSKAGWKGKGVWSAYAGRATHHIEGGKGTKPKVVKFQFRPDPLAK